MKKLLEMTMMKTIQTTLLGAGPLYTCKGTDPSFAAVLKSDGRALPA